MMSINAYASVQNFGSNVTWTEFRMDDYCNIKSESIGILPNYQSVRSKVQNQLSAMKLSEIDTLRIFVEWGDIQPRPSNSPVYPIDPPSTSLPDSYFTNINNFLLDAKAAGIQNVIIAFAGFGSYGASCTSDLTNIVLPTFENTVDKLMSQVVLSPGSKPNIKIDLQNEISPSNYGDQCFKDAATSFIKSLWSYYVSHYGNSRASFSSILDNSTDPRIAGNRLANLIAALKSSGYALPTWFDVHAYESRSGTVNMLRGVYQIYSDYGLLSNGAEPKETVVGETFYEDQDSANGISDYLAYYDGYNGGSINLTTVVDWPVPGPSQHNTCGQFPRYSPPYKKTVYKNVLSYGYTNLPTISASPLVTANGTTTLSWNSASASRVGIRVSVNGQPSVPNWGGDPVGSYSPNWLNGSGNFYTFLIYADPGPGILLDSVTVFAQ